MRAISFLAASRLVLFTEIAWRGILGPKLSGMSWKFWMVKHDPASLPSILMIVGVLPLSNMLPIMPCKYPLLLTTGVDL